MHVREFSCSHMSESYTTNNQPPTGNPNLIWDDAPTLNSVFQGWNMLKLETTSQVNAAKKQSQTEI
jgi:hypothetical protein